MRSLFEQHAFDPRFTSVTKRSWIGTVALSLVAAVAVVIILMHAVLIPVGNWRYDEFDTFRHIRDGGLSFVWARIVGWSPRPVSELIIYGYSNLVQATGRPNIGIMLGLLWTALTVGVLAPTVPLLKRSRIAFSTAATIGLTILAMFLVGHRIDEVFYWTQGAAAYISTLACVAAVALLHISQPRFSPMSHLLANGLAVLAALSSEMGASFAIVYGTLMFAASHIQIGSNWGLTRPKWADCQFVAPIAAGLLVFYLSASGRLGVSQEAVGDPAVLHQIVPSLIAAFWYAPDEFLSLGPVTNGTAQYTWGILVVVAFCAGVFGLLAAGGVSAERRSALRLLAIGLSALAAVVVSILAAYYQFGIVCCSRHETMRRCLWIVAAVCIMSFLYSLLSDRLRSCIGRGSAIAVSCTLLLGSMVASSLVTFPYLVADLRNYSELRAASLSNWESGTASGPNMDYTPSKSKIVCGPGSLMPGKYRLGENMPTHIAYVAKYFGKSEIAITGNDEVCNPL